MTSLTDNIEITEILNILEKMEDQEMATKLLKEFNNATKLHGQLLMNKDSNLSHDDWKKQCDLAQINVIKIVDKIKKFE